MSYPSSPSYPNYASFLANMIGGLPARANQAQQQQIQLQQERQQQAQQQALTQAFKGGVPLTSGGIPDARALMQMFAKAGDYPDAVNLAPQIIQQQQFIQNQNDTQAEIDDAEKERGTLPPASAAASASTTQPRGIRNNNPDNIENGGFAQSQPGYTGVEPKGRYAQFATPEEGLDAAGNLISDYSKKGINTVAGVVSRWAPLADGNNVPKYARFVAQQLGVSPTQPIDLSDPAVRKSLAQAMAKYENGTGAAPAPAATAPSPAPQAVPQGAPAAPPQMQPPIAGPGATPAAQPMPPQGGNIAQLPPASTASAPPQLELPINPLSQQPFKDPQQAIKWLRAMAGRAENLGNKGLADAKNKEADQIEAMLKPPKFGVIGKDQYQQPTYGWIDPQTQTVTPLAPMTGSQASGPPGVSNIHGDAYLQTLDPNMGNQVKALAEGRLAFPSGFALKSPYWQQMLQSVAQYDPSFDAVQYNARARARTDATSGKLAQNNNSLNTGIGHLGQLADAVDALHNTNWQTYNAVKNRASAEFGGTAPTNFDAIKNRVAPEIVKIWRGTGGAESDIKRDINSLSDAKSPAQLYGAIREIANLMQSKIESNRAQYEQAMGPSGADQQMITPQSQEILDRLEHLAGGPGGSASNASRSRQIATGQTATNRQTGKKVVWDGQKWNSL